MEVADSNVDPHWIQCLFLGIAVSDFFKAALKTLDVTYPPYVMQFGPEFEAWVYVLSGLVPVVIVLTLRYTERGREFQENIPRLGGEFEPVDEWEETEL